MKAISAYDAANNAYDAAIAQGASHEAATSVAVETRAAYAAANAAWLAASKSAAGK